MADTDLQGTSPRSAATEAPAAECTAPRGSVLTAAFFDRDPQVVACDLLGKVLWHRVEGRWLGASLIETEAYYRADKASHAWLGYTEKRKALFMAPGTIYMYYARGGDSFNVSCRGEGNAVLFKAGFPYLDGDPDAGGPDQASAAQAALLAEMRRRNPLPSGHERPWRKLCAGQTLLCRSLGLRVPAWDQILLGASGHETSGQQSADQQTAVQQPAVLHLLDVGYRPTQVLRTTRLGIPPGRDGHLPYRFVDRGHAGDCTRNPLRRGAEAGREYTVLELPAGTLPPGWLERALAPRHAEAD